MEKLPSSLEFVLFYVARESGSETTVNLSLTTSSSQSQSAYRPFHNALTVLLNVADDILCWLDEEQVSILTLLDQSAIFDTIDHFIRFSRLPTFFYDVLGSALV